MIIDGKKEAALLREEIKKEIISVAQEENFGHFFFRPSKRDSEEKNKIELKFPKLIKKITTSQL